MTQNSNNQDYSNETDGFILGGGTTKRDLTVTGADITLTGSGANTYTFPASTDTLVGRDSTDTLTNKTLTSGTNTFPTFNQNTTGSAATLTTPRTINGTSFNGSSNITVPSDITPGTSGNVLTSNGTVWTSAAAAGGGNAQTADPLSQFAATTSAQLAGVISNETGSGLLVFGTAPNITNPTGIVKGDVGLGNVDNTSNATERAATATLTNKDLSSSTNTFPDFYPVGTQYTNLSNSANPSTYLPGQSGSTWVANSGTVTVAKAASGTFNTAGATGGAETHTHPLSDDGYAKMDWDGTQEAITGTEVTADSYAINRTTGDLGTDVTSASGTSTGGAGLGGDTDSGSTLQPYVVKYVWDRTA